MTARRRARLPSPTAPSRGSGPADASRAEWGDRDGRRRDILWAGRELIGVYGYARLHMRQVAKLAGVSPGTVYTYFPSKEVLYSALYAQRLDAFADELAALRAASATHEDLFVNVAVAYADVHRGFAAAQDIWRLSGDAAAFDSEHTARLATAARRVVDEIDRVAGRLRPEPTPEADEPFGALLWSVLLGLAQQHTGTPSPEWERLARFATRTLRVGWQSPSATTTSADKENQHR